MKRYKITLMIPAEEEVVVSDLQAAHNEATRLAVAMGGKTPAGAPKALVQSIEFIGDVATEPLNFDPVA